MTLTPPTYTRLDMQDMGVAFLYLFLGILAAGAALGAEIAYKQKLYEKVIICSLLVFKGGNITRL